MKIKDVIRKIGNLALGKVDNCIDREARISMEFYESLSNEQKIILNNQFHDTTAFLMGLNLIIVVIILIAVIVGWVF